MSIRGIISGMAERANPAFALGGVEVPIAAFALAAAMGSIQLHTYVYAMAGVHWTGIDVFMALVIGPVLGALSVDERANWVERFTPKMPFLMQTLAAVTIFGESRSRFAWGFSRTPGRGSGCSSSWRSAWLYSSWSGRSTHSAIGGGRRSSASCSWPTAGICCRNSWVPGCACRGRGSSTSSSWQ